MRVLLFGIRLLCLERECRKCREHRIKKKRRVELILLNRVIFDAIVVILANQLVLT